MTLALALLTLSQSPPPRVAVSGDQEPNAASLWSAPRDGSRFGLGVAGTLNVMAHSDLAGVSLGVHLDWAIKHGRVEARVAPSVTLFGGWNGHDGFGWLVTGSVEASARLYFWRMLAFGAGAMAGLSRGEFQNCTEALFWYGAPFCTPDVKSFYASIAPVLYPLEAALPGGHDVALQLSWPIALGGQYTFPSVMIRYTHTF